MPNNDNTEALAAQDAPVLDVQTSSSIGAIADALAKAQGEMTSAKKDAANPFFKSQYADLASVWEAVRAPLSKNSIAVIQIPTNGTDGRVGSVTIFAHKSGEFMRGRLLVRPAKDDPQAAGSAITYTRRYSLMAMAGIAADDDDGEGAMNRKQANGTVDAKTAQESRNQSSQTAAKNGTSTTSKTASDAPLKTTGTWITEPTLKKLEGFRKTEEGEKVVQTLLGHWKLKSFDELTEAEALKAVSWISGELKANAKNPSNNQAA
jgi:hypothetical protein